MALSSRKPVQLSEHFTLYELTKSQTAIRRRIDNRAPKHVIPRLRRLALGVLEPVRAQYGAPFSPASGYRCPALNLAVGSHPSSQHIRGEAVDFEVPGVSNRDLAGWIAGELIFDQLILEFYQPGEPASGWVHCSLCARNNRGRILWLNHDGVHAGLPD